MHTGFMRERLKALDCPHLLSASPGRYDWKLSSTSTIRKKDRLKIIPTEGEIKQEAQVSTSREES